MTKPDIPLLVASIRKKNGWTQERLAQEVGVSFSTVNNWERGKRSPQPFLQKRLLEIAGESPGVKGTK